MGDVNRWTRMMWRRRGVRIHVARGADLTLGDAVQVGEGTRLTVNAGRLSVGTGAHIGERCTIVVHERVEIAAGARIEDWVSITDFEPVDDDPERPVREQGVRARPVVVGEGAVVDLAANLTAGASVAPLSRVEPHEVR
jgi:acetyltransferase-like isoleucine patch superfamily enzyme